MSDGSSNDDSPITGHQPRDDEISFLDLAIVLAKHKNLVLGVPLIAGIGAIVISLLLPLIYTGTTRILPPQQSQSSTVAMLGQLTSQLGGFGGLAGGALGLKNPNDMYVGMLKSRTVADNLINRFDLKKVYDVETYHSARQQLEVHSFIQAGRDGIIIIEVDDKDPKRAAELANGYVDELYKLTQTLAVTEASQRRLFFERQLEQARKNLIEAEATARQGLEKGGLVIVDAQGRALVETTARLRGQISVKEIQISSMQSFATASNPDLQQAQYELDAMKRELAKIESSGTGGPSKGEKSGSMENVRLLRDVRYRETVYELLARQYELAKLDEAKDASLIQVLDKAISPEKKSKPKRPLIVILTVVLAGFIGILWAFLREAGERMRQNPQQAERLNVLRRYLWGK